MFCQYITHTTLQQSTIVRLNHALPFSNNMSCPAVNEEAFDRFTQVPWSFRQFLKGMELLRSSGLPFCLKTKAMNWNKEEIPQIRRFVESFGLTFGFTTSLSPRLNGDLSTLTYRLAPEEIRSLEDRELYSAQDEEPCQDTSDWTSSSPERLYRCGCATNSIHISAWGDVGTCTLQYEHRASVREYSLKDAIAKVFAEDAIRRA